MANIDHTVKVASIIGLLQGGRWMKQYDSLFAVMNELGRHNMAIRMVNPIRQYKLY